MKFAYFTEDSEKSLSPFFSPFMMQVVVNSTFIIAGLIIVFWPWQYLFSFISRSTVPFIFFKVFTVALLIHSYVSVRCGRGEMVKVDYYTKYYQKEVDTFEKTYNFLSYGLVEFILHTLFLLFPLCPILLLATALSGLSFITFVKGCSVLFTASLLCRMFSFTVYLFWGRFSSAGYLIARVLMGIFVALTATFAPISNPIMLLYRFNGELQHLGLSADTFYTGYMLTVTGTIVIFTVTNQLIVRHVRHKENNDASSLHSSS